MVDDDRWVEVTPSQFPHEAEGLRIVRDLMPKRAPFRAWTNFEFRDDRGNWSEVDLLILAPDGLHLVELKYYSGRLRGTDTTWLRDGHAAQDSPLLLANRKAKRLRSKLMAAYDDWRRGQKFAQPPPSARDLIPFIQESVFLHHPGFVCELPESSRTGLYGLPGHEAASGLAPVTDLFTGTPRPDAQIRERAIAAMMQRIGLRARPREAGSYVLDKAPLEDGPGWQDWLATHKHVKSQRRRIRFRVVPEGASEQARRRVHLLAAHEMHVMQRLTHEAIVRPEDYVDSELGPGLIYPHEEGWQRLDLWLADEPSGFDYDAQLDLIRQVAEALAYAHGKNVVHRGLGPRAIKVTTENNGRRRVTIGDWQGVGRTDEATVTSATRGITTLMDADRHPSAAQERWVEEGFAAPEGVLVGAPDRLRLDVFGLGALAFYIVTGGQAPARTRADLTARLNAQGGLDVSVELPTVAPALREAILAATRPEVSKRLPDVAAFLAELDKAMTPQADETTDPLDAGPGAVLDDRFELVSRLGAGSTAVGLLVKDGPSDDGPQRVLKVALDDSAGRRLDDEAESLRRLTSPRIVKIIEGPLVVGGRRALLLASAGRETLATHLGNRERLPLDLLERWGTDLLEAVVTLDEAGISHRDIKPANLGVREDRSNKSNRSKHLVLFDFSLTRAPASDTQAGTRPYLDPFFNPKRPQYDSAAERYAAAVVLYEMATGHTPVYGDGLSDPASINDEATIDPDGFDPALRKSLTAFFTRALARNHKARHDTAAQMLLEWRASFPEASTPAEDAVALAEAATAETALADSGLSARALSALEQLHVRTVGELAGVDARLLNRLPNLTAATRGEVQQLTKIWRPKFGRRGAWRPAEEPTDWDHPLDAADTLLNAARTPRGDNAVTVASLLLGVTGRLGANATQSELAASLKPPVTRGRISQLLATLQDRWAADDEALDLLDRLIGVTNERLVELGGVATFDELADHLLTLMTPRRGVAGADELRTVEGLLRCALDRKAAIERAGDDALPPWSLRRREGRPVLVAVNPTLLDVAEALGHRADALVSDTNVSGNDALVPAARAATALGAEVPDQVDTETGSQPVTAGLRDGRRLARLGAVMSHNAGASAVGELHHRHLAPAAALRHALPSVVPGVEYSADALRERVANRFPNLAPLPKRPDLDHIVTDAAAGLHWDEARRSYHAPRPHGQTTGLDTRSATIHVRPSSLSGPGPIGQRLIDSRERRSFVALGVPAGAVADRLGAVLRDRFEAVGLDLTHTLLEALHRTAATLKVPWDLVLMADADAPASRASQGLHALVRQSLPTVAQAIRQTLTDAGGRPVVLTDASLLARHDALGLLAEWMDLATTRPTALWLVVPQLHANNGPMVDGQPLPLAAPSQFVPVTQDWVDAQRPALEGSTP